MKRLLLLLLPALVLLVPAPMRGQVTSRAGVVVKFSDGSVHTNCVSFADDSISGLELLQRSGLDVIAQTSGNNAAVCKIGPDGCNFPAESCLACKFGGGGSGQGEYWAYWILNGAAWRYSQQGAGIRRVRDGEVDGWAYGAGNVQTGAQPPVTTFDQICPALPPTPQPVVEPTTPPPPAPRPTTRPTVEPTRVPVPTAVPTKAIVASAPTRTPVPPTPTNTPPTNTPVVATEQPSSSPTAIPTTAPTSTTVPTGTTIPTPTAQPTRAPAPVAAPVTSTAIIAGAAPQPRTATGMSYAIFAAMLTVLLAAVGVAVRRRRR